MSFGCDEAVIRSANGWDATVRGLQVGLWLVCEKLLCGRQMDADGKIRPSRTYHLAHLPSGKAVDFSRVEDALAVADLISLRTDTAEAKYGPELKRALGAFDPWLRACWRADRFFPFDGWSP